MNPKEQLMTYKKKGQMKPQAEKMQETIRKSKEVFFAAEQEKMLSYHEFLWSQFKMVQKRWWILQFLLLSLLGAALVSAYEESYIQRGMGIMATLFVILIIPELWKNRSCHSMEIEESSYYSLRQIYSARMVLFGIIDLLLLTVFCTTMTIGLNLEFMELLVQFLLPMLVTACICFGTLCSKHMIDETAAIILCVLWCGIWLVITLDEKIYTMITLPIWLICIGLSFGFLCIAIWRTLNNCSNYWEVGFDEIRIE